MKTILIVDQDHAMRAALKDFFAHALPESRVLQARSEEEGLSYFQTTMPDMVLIDMYRASAGDDGLAQQVRHNAAWQRTSLVLMTATTYGYGGATQRPDESLFDRVLVKPFSYGDLLQAVSAVRT